MALFGSGAPQGGQLMGGTPTAAVAEQTGATASSPFLQYLQQNAPAARQTAQTLMGEAPEPDYRAALLQAGLGILSQPGGQSPLQAIAKGASSAVPLYLQEQERVKNYEQQVGELASKLNMGAAEFDAKLGGERKGIKCFNGVCIDEDSYQQALRETGGDMEAAFDRATVHKKRPTAQENSRHLAQLRRNLELMKTSGKADPQEIQMAQDELEAMEAQIFDEQGESINFAWMDESGTFRTASGPPADVAEGIAQFRNVEQVSDLKTKQEATDQVLYYTSNILDVYDRASVLSGGTLGGLASSASAWSKAINETMSGDRVAQFREDVGDNPNRLTQQLREDPEARNLLGESFLDKLEGIGADRAEALSNFYGLAYATARAEEPGGRLSNADIASAMMSTGFDPDAMLNDPAAIKRGVLSIAKRNLSSYERAIDLADIPADQKEKMLANDAVLNKRLKEYGFTWSGGAKGELVYDPLADDENAQDDVSTTDPQADPAQQNPEQAGEAVQVQSKEQFDQLPSGTRFVAPDGSVRVKP